MSLKVIGKNLMRLRKDRGLTPLQMAKAAGISETAYRLIEIGHPRQPGKPGSEERAQNHALLAAVFGLTAAQLRVEAAECGPPSFPRMFHSLEEMRAFLAAQSPGEPQ
jgi:transcriptional regulator with XRE-family HTH domain